MDFFSLFWNINYKNDYSFLKKKDYLYLPYSEIFKELLNPNEIVFKMLSSTRFIMCVLSLKPI